MVYEKPETVEAAVQALDELFQDPPERAHFLASLLQRPVSDRLLLYFAKQGSQTILNLRAAFPYHDVIRIDVRDKDNNVVQPQHPFTPQATSTSVSRERKTEVRFAFLDLESNAEVFAEPSVALQHFKATAGGRDVYLKPLSPPVEEFDVDAGGPRQLRDITNQQGAKRSGTELTPALNTTTPDVVTVAFCTAQSVNGRKVSDIPFFDYAYGDCTLSINSITPSTLYDRAQMVLTEHVERLGLVYYKGSREKATYSIQELRLDMPANTVTEAIMQTSRQIAYVDATWSDHPPELALLVAVTRVRVRQGTIWDVLGTLSLMRLRPPDEFKPADPRGGGALIGSVAHTWSNDPRYCQVLGRVLEGRITGTGGLVVGAHVQPRWWTTIHSQLLDLAEEMELELVPLAEWDTAVNVMQACRGLEYALDKGYAAIVAEKVKVGDFVYAGFRWIVFCMEDIPLLKLHEEVDPAVSQKLDDGWLTVVKHCPPGLQLPQDWRDFSGVRGDLEWADAIVSQADFPGTFSAVWDTLVNVLGKCTLGSLHNRWLRPAQNLAALYAPPKPGKRGWLGKTPNPTDPRHANRSTHFVDQVPEGVPLPERKHLVPLHTPHRLSTGACAIHYLSSQYRNKALITQEKQQELQRIRMIISPAKRHRNDVDRFLQHTAVDLQTKMDAFRTGSYRSVTSGQRLGSIRSGNSMRRGQSGLISPKIEFGPGASYPGTAPSARSTSSVCQGLETADASATRDSADVSAP